MRKYVKRVVQMADSDDMFLNQFILDYPNMLHNPNIPDNQDVLFLITMIVLLADKVRPPLLSVGRSRRALVCRQYFDNVFFCIFFLLDILDNSNILHNTKILDHPHVLLLITTDKVRPPLLSVGRSRRAVVCRQ